MTSALASVDYTECHPDCTTLKNTKSDRLETHKYHENRLATHYTVAVALPSTGEFQTFKDILVVKLT